MPPKGHAVLSASSSERWLNCPPSARLCEAYEDKGSDYAAEGIDAHALCEFRLKQALGIQADNPIENLSWYNEEMEDCAVGYAAYVTELLETAKQACTDPVVLIEQRVDFSRWVKDGFGTADCILIADGTLNICDYKHGKGIEVIAVGNPQMRLYALGALEIFDGIYDIDTVRMTIFQPRKSNVSIDEMDICGNPAWEYAGLYTDDGVSATSTARREGFNRLIADALDGKIDRIITKSVSRFARNTVDSLTTIRRLKEKGVGVTLEKPANKKSTPK